MPEAGTVEYCANGAWRAVCDRLWTYKEAFVLCRQLGFPATGRDVETVLIILFIFNSWSMLTYKLLCTRCYSIL